MKSLHIILLILLFSIPAFAQSAAMTNGDVIDLLKTGLSAEVIVAKIRASETKFDISTNALKALAEAKIPDSVIVAMLDRQRQMDEQSAAVKKQDADTRAEIPEQGSLSDLKAINAKKVYIYSENLKSRDLIIKEMLKAKFEVVDKIEDSDFALGYVESEEELGASAVVNGNVATARRLTQTVGNLKIIMPGSPNSNRLRLIYSTRKTKYYVWEDNPAKSTTKQFLKDLGKAVEEK